MKKNIMIGFLIIVIFVLGWMYHGALGQANSDLELCTQQDVDYYLNYRDLETNKPPTRKNAECSSGVQATINYFNTHPSYTNLYIKVPTPTK